MYIMNLLRYLKSCCGFRKKKQNIDPDPYIYYDPYANDGYYGNISDTKILLADNDSTSNEWTRKEQNSRWQYSSGNSGENDVSIW